MDGARGSEGGLVLDVDQAVPQPRDLGQFVAIEGAVHLQIARELDHGTQVVQGRCLVLDLGLGGGLYGFHHQTEVIAHLRRGMVGIQMSPHVLDEDLKRRVDPADIVEDGWIRLAFREHHAHVLDHHLEGEGAGHYSSPIGSGKM